MALPSTRSLYAAKHVLIIDDMPDMRTSLRNQLSTLAITKVSNAGSVRDAIEILKSSSIDIILCDYYLGGSTDGQQLLEYLRSSGLISRAVLFIMITAETGYQSVVTAAECLPDDYLLKPFTADTLAARFEKLIEKKMKLSVIDKMQDKGQWNEIIAACDALIADKDKYLIDALRIKGNALLMSRQYELAKNFYDKALAMRPLPWAKLGLAKAYHGLKDSAQAKSLLDDIIGENKQFLAAYDLLGSIHMGEGNHEKAMGILDEACKVSPNSLTRHRSIATIAEDTGDYARVEQSLSHVIQRTRNSPLRNSADYVKLGNALTESGDPAKAISLLGEAKQVFKDGKDVRHIAAVEAVAQKKAGNEELSQQALSLALQGGEASSDEMALAIAKACLEHGKEDEAMAVLKSVVQNNPDSVSVHGRVSSLMKAQGKEDLSQELISSSVKEIIALNNEAVAKAKAGEFAVAAKMLAEAEARLPNNLQIVANAAFCLLLDIFKNGMDATKFREAKRMQASVLNKDHNHPKLVEIADLLKRLESKTT